MVRIDMTFFKITWYTAKIVYHMELAELMVLFIKKLMVKIFLNVFYLLRIFLNESKIQGNEKNRHKMRMGDNLTTIWERSNNFHQIH